MFRYCGGEMLEKLMRHSGNARFSRGFTIIELMFVLVLLAVLTTLAAPSYRSFMINKELSSASSDFLIAMMQARSDALRLGQPVAVLPTNGTSWDGGWYLSVVDTNCAPVGDAFGKREALDSNITIKSTTSQSFAHSNPSFTYSAVGFPVTSCASPYYSGAMDGAIVFEASETARERQVIVSKTGRARVCDPKRETCALG